MNGATNVEDARYLVTYNFRASRNAAGTFNVSVQTGDETFLLAPDSSRLSVRNGQGTEVVVGQAGGRSLKGR